MASSSRFTRRQLSIDCEDGKDNILHMVVPRLYIGSIYAALEREQMKEKGITHILNASRFQSTFPEDFTYLSIDIKDKDDSNILPCIPSANIFIEAGMQSGGVLVHCYGGRSRSAAFWKNPGASRRAFMPARLVVSSCALPSHHGYLLTLLTAPPPAPLGTNSELLSARDGPSRHPGT